MASEKTNGPFQEVRRIGKLSKNGVFIYHRQEKRLLFLNASLVKIVEINEKLLMEEPALMLHAIGEEDVEFVAIKFSELLQESVLEDVQIKLRQNEVRKTLSVSAYVSSDGACIAGFVKDITKPEEHEEYLINFGARKDALLDMVSQNLNTPLNLSKFTVGLIEKAVQERKFYKLDTHIALMREVIAECIRIIDDFMRREHLQSPEIHTKSNRFDLIAKIMIILDQLKQSNADRQIKIDTDVNHLFVTGDDLKFFQIIHNLLSNSIKFTKANGVITVAVKNHKNRVEVVVKDDGIGIPDELQPFIFEKGGRATRPGLNGEASHGIGLYIVKKLTGLMGGSISFESKENKGTKFRLELPKN